MTPACILPVVLALAASAPPCDEREVLARVVASEVGGPQYGDDERRAVAWVVRNRYVARGETLCGALYPWGRQLGARQFSTRLAADDADRALAEEVLSAPWSHDPTWGATSFFEPAVQDRIAGQRVGHVLTSSAVRARWGATGECVGRVGRVELWRRKRQRPEM